MPVKIANAESVGKFSARLGYLVGRYQDVDNGRKLWGEGEEEVRRRNRMGWPQESKQETAAVESRRDGICR